MSCSTILYIANNISLRDLITVIERKLETKCTIDSNSPIDNCGRINFIVSSKITNAVEETRSLFYNYHSNTPIGSAMYLSLGMWGKSDDIMFSIAEIFGGFFKHNDCDENGFTKIAGALNLNDGIPFLNRHAIIKGTMKDNNDINGLKETMNMFDR